MSSKFQKLLLSYIQVRGVVLEKIFLFVKEKQRISFNDILNQYGDVTQDSSKSFVWDCIKFLATVSLIDVKDEKTDNDKIISITKDVLATMPFKGLLLHHLRLSVDDSFYTWHKALVENDTLKIESSDVQKIAETSLSSEFTWNREKTGFFLDLLEFVELGKRIGTSDLLNVPSKHLIKTLLLLYASQGDIGGGSRRNKTNDAREVPIRKFVDYLRSNYMECYTLKGKLYKGMQYVLEDLSERNEIELKLQSDAALGYEPLTIGEKSVSSIILVSQEK